MLSHSACSSKHPLRWFTRLRLPQGQIDQLTSRFQRIPFLWVVEMQSCSPHIISWEDCSQRHFSSSSFSFTSLHWFFFFLCIREKALVLPFKAVTPPNSSSCVRTGEFYSWIWSSIFCRVDGKFTKCFWGLPRWDSMPGWWSPKSSVTRSQNFHPPSEIFGNQWSASELAHCLVVIWMVSSCVLDPTTR